MKETGIELLSELCMSLQSLYISSPVLPIGISDHIYLENVGLANIAVVHHILEDSQQRLVFRVQAYLKEEILGFRIRDEEILLFLRKKERNQN